jgi:hypothetical protein
LDHKAQGDEPPADARGAKHESGADHDRIIDELRLLLDAVAQRADEYLSKRAETAAMSSPSCGWCPLCTVVAMLRDQRPDLRLVEQLAAVVTVIRQLLAEPQGEPPQPDPPEPAPEAKAQRIDIQRVGGRVLRDQVAAREGRGC